MLSAAPECHQEILCFSASLGEDLADQVERPGDTNDRGGAGRASASARASRGEAADSAPSEPPRGRCRARALRRQRARASGGQDEAGGERAGARRGSALVLVGEDAEHEASRAGRGSTSAATRARARAPAGLWAPSRTTTGFCCEDLEPARAIAPPASPARIAASLDAERARRRRGEHGVGRLVDAEEAGTRTSSSRQPGPARSSAAGRAARSRATVARRSRPSKRSGTSTSSARRTSTAIARAPGAARTATPLRMMAAFSAAISGSVEPSTAWWSSRCGRSPRPPGAPRSWRRGARRAPPRARRCPPPPARSGRGRARSTASNIVASSRATSVPMASTPSTTSASGIGRPSTRMRSARTTRCGDV